MPLKPIAVATAVLLATPAVVLAQETTPAPQPGAASEQYSDEQVGAFADAIGAAAAVDQEWRPKIEAAQNLDEARDLTAQSQGAMAAAIEDTGMTVEAYNEMYVDAQLDSELAERINVALRERMDDEADG